MSRGSRFGGAAAKVSGAPLPFDVDPALESEIAAFRANDEKDVNDKRRHYPPMKVPHAPPLTPYEKRLVAAWREDLATRRASPFFLDDVNIGKRDPANFNAFEDVPSWSNQKYKDKDGLPDLRKLPIIWEHLPPELQALRYDNGRDSDDDEGNDDKMDLSFLDRRARDPLDAFHDDDDMEGKADAEDDEGNDDEDEDEEKADDEVDGIDELQDDEFEEDEDDAAGDYHGEKYFSNGEDDHDMDDGGAEEAW